MDRNPTIPLTWVDIGGVNFGPVEETVRIDGPRGGGELGLFQISKTNKATLTYAKLVRLNSPTG